MKTADPRAAGTASFKLGDVVCLKSGSPTMVIIKIPRKSGEPVTCLYWNQEENEGVEVLVPMEALETPESRIKREYELKRLVDGTRHITLPDHVDPERTMVIAFDTIEDKMEFIQSRFNEPGSARVLN